MGKKHNKEHAPRDPAIPHFAHESEREFARLLDFYQIQWQYEPNTFTLETDEAGQVRECYATDFYLPELDLYIELTTMKQSLVTKKNRKLRHLKELYPEINIKLLYRRDFRTLMMKYGLNPDEAMTGVHSPHPVTNEAEN
jgi:hypoxanthine phosphoribosyltransferase